MTYTINYTNHGNQNATGVLLTETLPAGTTFVGGNIAWVHGSGSTYTAALGGLASGASGSATFLVTVKTPAADDLHRCLNSRRIPDQSANGADPTADNTGSDSDTL